MGTFPRVAFLPDTFHEVNGVAHTSRQFEAFARRSNIPFLSVHCGPATETKVDGSVRVVQLKRGPASFELDANLACDPLLFRYAHQVAREMKNFGAQLVHVTGPGDMGCVGFYVSLILGLPLVMSWHTSLHEYAGRRLQDTLSFTSDSVSRPVSKAAEKASLAILKWFYRRGKLLFAPNTELIQMLKQFTRKPVFLMSRGVDTDLFSPARRNRFDRTFRMGYVGRLTVEKNVRFLADLGHALTALGRTNFEFVLIGQGSEDNWLREHVPHSVLTGVLRGKALAEAYANMDLFVFPSKTDTFGNVVLEALSSGVPAVVTANGGPKFLVQDGFTGCVAHSDIEFVQAVNAVMTNNTLHRNMCQAARAYACRQSWDAVFTDVFRHYEECLQPKRGVLTGSHA